MLRSMFLSACFALLAANAVAQVSDIVSAPDARSRNKGQFVLQYRVTTTDDHLDSRYTHNFKGTYGLGYGVELGFTTDLNGKNAIGAKYQFFTSEDNKIAASAGIMDITENSQLFFAVEKKFQGFTLATGFVTNEDQFFVGGKTGWMNDFKYSADYLGGRIGKTSLRLQRKINENFEFDVRMFIPNNSNKPNTFRFGINYTVQY